MASRAASESQRVRLDSSPGDRGQLTEAIHPHPGRRLARLKWEAPKSGSLVRGSAANEAGWSGVEGQLGAEAGEGDYPGAVVVGQEHLNAAGYV